MGIASGRLDFSSEKREFRFLFAGSGIANAVLPESELELDPSFDKEQMDADIETELSLPLFKVVIPLIRFFRRVRTI
jgi:hypothetical protein